MNKPVTQTLKGFRDFLPEETKKRQWLKNKMEEVFEKWGFVPIETPTLEPLEIFEGQIGEDEKMFFKFEDRGGRKVALRYDQTVPTCRFIGENFNSLIFPFKRYQIQPAFRAENPQKGRYREFVQADIDIIGSKSPLADAECITLSIDLYKQIGFEKPIALINNRNLLAGIPYSAIAAVDKLKKIGKAGVLKEIQEKGFSENDAKSFFDKIENLQPDETLKTIFDYLDALGLKENYKFEPTLARSFSYSEGPIWEITIEGYSTSSFGGSVGGGERYDALLKKISGQDIGATGIAFGFDRTLEAAEMLGIVPPDKSSTKVLVTIFSPELLDKSLEITARLREKGINTEIYTDADAKLDKQLKYADRKGIPFAIILGPEEVSKNGFMLKNLGTKEQKFCNSIDEIGF